MGTADEGVEQGGCECLYHGPYLLGGGLVGHNLRFRYVCPDTPHWEGLGRILPQGVLQVDGEATSERKGSRMCLPPAGFRDGGGCISGGGDLRLPPPEYSCTVCCG